MVTRAELDQILPYVAKPARYVGYEWNSILKDWDHTDVRIALAYPDTYEVGMSNLGLAILYDIINRQPHALAERVYAPWPDMSRRMKEAGIPLYSLESYHPLSDFDIIGFTLQHELNYTNVLSMLDSSSIPLLASQRRETDPLVIAGGSCTYNPEPIADFFDLFVIGEGEEVILEIIMAFQQWKQLGPKRTRRGLLSALSHVPGVYIPSFYDVKYCEDGTILAITPNQSEAPTTIRKRIVASDGRVGRVTPVLSFCKVARSTWGLIRYWTAA